VTDEEAHLRFELADLKIRHEREMREANERSTATALKLQTAEQGQRLTTALAVLAILAAVVAAYHWR
jgi:hypothetical protein